MGTVEKSGSPNTPSHKSSRFHKITYDFWLAYRSYNEFLRHVSSSLAGLPDLDPKIVEEITGTLVRRIPVHDLLEVAKALRDIARRSLIDNDKQGDVSPDDITEHTGDSTVEPSIPMNETVARTVYNIMRRVRGHVSPHKHRQLLYRSIVTGIVTQFEILLSDIAHEFFARAPLAIESEDKVLSVGELRQFNTVEDAIEFVVDRKVDDLLRGTVDDWRKFLSTRMKVDLPSLCLDWERFDEYIQRRHILIHTGGNVSRRYLDRVSPKLVSEYFGTVSPGDGTVLGEEYVQACLLELSITGLRLAFESWAKLFDGEKDVLALSLVDIVYDLLLRGDWTLAEALALWGSRREDFDLATLTVCRFNGWLCAKRRGQWHRVEPEVLEYDTSALHPRFVAAHAALNGDCDRFFDVVHASGGASLDALAWDEWPILEEMRADPRFLECKARYGGEPPASPTSEVPTTHDC